MKDGHSAVESLTGDLDSRSEDYLDSFLALADPEAEKSKSKDAKKNKVKTWLEATPEDRPYVIKSKIEAALTDRSSFEMHLKLWQAATASACLPLPPTRHIY